MGLTHNSLTITCDSHDLFTFTYDSLTCDVFIFYMELILSLYTTHLYLYMILSHDSPFKCDSFKWFMDVNVWLFYTWLILIHMWFFYISFFIGSNILYCTFFFYCGLPLLTFLFYFIFTLLGHEQSYKRFTAYHTVCIHDKIWIEIYFICSTLTHFFVKLLHLTHLYSHEILLCVTVNFFLHLLILHMINFHIWFLQVISLPLMRLF